MSQNQKDDTQHLTVSPPPSNLVALQNLPRRIKRENKIKIDVGKTQYPLLRIIAINDLGWRLWTREESKEQINVYWVDTYVHEEFVRKIKPYQRVNHFPASENLGKKNLIANAINRMKKIAPKDYLFFPTTFNFPSEVEQFEKYTRRKQGNPYYIIKPCADSQGRGIYLTKSPDTNSKEELVVQEYIDSPLLLDQSKFDLRLYVLLRSLSPLKIYLYSQGLCRLATSSYEKPNSENNNNTRMHLTNYAINKLSPDFIFNNNELQDNVGHKRSLSAALNTLKKMGCNIDVLQQEIDKIIVKTIFAVHGILLKKYKELRDWKEEAQSVCFQILGFDILIKNDYTPVLLEVNHSPSFTAETPLDHVIKKHLLLDTLNLLNLTHEDKINYLKSRNQQDNIHNNQIMRTYAKNLAKQVEPEEIGAYRKLFPLDPIPENQEINKLYERLFKTSKQEKSSPSKSLAPPIASRVPFFSQKLDCMHAPGTTQKQSHSLSFYSVINNMRKTKLKQLQQVIDFQRILPPTSAQLRKKQQHTIDLNIINSNPELDLQSIQNEQLIMYEKRAKKEREKEKRKYILPAPLNNVNIRLDDRFSLKPDKHKEKHYKDQSTPFNQTQFKIHSMFNSNSERKKHRDQGNKTMSNGFKDTHLNEQIGKTNDRDNHFIDSRNNSYSIELKQKIERMQLARLRIQRLRKADKGNFMIIHSHSPEK